MRQCWIVLGWLMAAVSSPVSALAQGWVDVTPVTFPAGFEPDKGGAYDPSRGIHVVLGNVAGTPMSVKYDGVACTLHSLPNWSIGASATTQAYYDPHYSAVVAINSIITGLTVTHALASLDGSSWSALPCPMGLLGDKQYLAGFDQSNGRSLLVGGAALGTFGGSPIYGQISHLLYGVGPTTVGGCPSYSTVSIVTTPNNAVSSFHPKLFYDDSVQRLVLWTSSTRAYEWSGSNWVQRFPAWPSGMDISYSRAAPSTQPEGALITRYTVINNSVAPRTFRYRNGQFTEQFLTSYPPESTNAVYVYDSARDVFVAFLSGGAIWELNLGPSAQFSTFGAGCLGSRSTPTLAPQQGSLPRIGTNFTLQALNLPLAGPVFLALGASDTLYGPTPLPLNLGPLGAPQCNLLVGIDNLYSTSNVLGAAAWTFPIPNIPGGIFFSQAIVFDAAANQFGVTLSNGGRGVVGS